MSRPPPTAPFSPLFDRALAACAKAQQLAARGTHAVAHARATRASARRTRALVSDARKAWADSDAIFSLMRHEVEVVATRMRDAGVDRHEAAATVRAHVRFVLYDGGMNEAAAEPVVQRASAWVELLFAA
jgi:hypothetical protein